MVRISVDLPAPFGPSNPYIPGGMVRETLSKARTPLGYDLDKPSIRSSIRTDLLIRTNDECLYVALAEVVPQPRHGRRVRIPRQPDKAVIIRAVILSGV